MGHWSIIWESRGWVSKESERSQLITSESVNLRNRDAQNLSFYCFHISTDFTAAQTAGHICFVYTTNTKPYHHAILFHTNNWTVAIRKKF